MSASTVRARAAARLPSRAAWRSLPWADAAHAAVVSAAPAILAVLLHAPQLGWSAIAAFWACFADPGGPLGKRLGAMSAVALLGALYCFIGSATQHALWLLLPMTFLCCATASLAQLTGPSNAIVGTLVCAGFVVSTALPTPDAHASAVYAYYFIGGGIWAIVMTALVWRRRPWRHATAAVAGCFVELGDYAHALSLRYMPSPPRAERHKQRKRSGKSAVVSNETPDPAAARSENQDNGTAASPSVNATSQPARSFANQSASIHDVSVAHRQLLRARIEAARKRVQEVLGSRPSRGERGHQLLALLDAAEHAFVVLVALSDTLAGRRTDGSPPERVRDACILRVLYRFGQSCDTTAEISDLSDPAQRAQLQQAWARVDQAVRQAYASEAARTGASDQASDREMRTVLTLLERLLDAGVDATSALMRTVPVAMNENAAASMEAPLQGRKTGGNTVEGKVPATENVTPVIGNIRDAVLRFAATLRRELHPRSSVARHAARVGIATTLSVFMCKRFDLNHGYWLSLTVVFVLQPYLTATWQRAAERIAGSVIGAVGAALVGILLPSPYAVAFAVLPIAIGTFVGRTVNYALFTFFVTLQFVLVAEIQQPASHELALAGLRALNSVYGGVLGLVIGFVCWPERGGERLAGIVAQALDKHAVYVGAVLNATADETEAPAGQTDQTGKAGKSETADPADRTALALLRRNACVDADNAQQLLRALKQNPLQRDPDIARSAALVGHLKALSAAATVLELQPWHQHRWPAVQVDRASAGALRTYATTLQATLRDAARKVRAGVNTMPTGDSADRMSSGPDIGEAGASVAAEAKALRPALTSTDPRWLALARLMGAGDNIARVMR